MRRKIIYGVGAIIILLLAAIAVPNFARTRVTSSGEPLEFKIQVVAQATGAPIEGAQVQINLNRGVTDAQGHCRLVGYFPATRSMGYSGQARLYGALGVTAPGFLEWEQQLKALFGPTYNFNQGTQITHVVKLMK